MAETDLRQAKEYGEYMEKIGWRAEKGAFIKQLPLIPFSFIKIQRQAWPLDFEAIERLAKKYRAVQIKIEPSFGDKTNYRQFGYKTDSSPLLPTKTIWLDLRKNHKELLKEMHHKTRYNIRKHEADGQEFEIIRGDKVKDDHLRALYEMYKKNAKRQGFWGVNFNQLKSLFEAFGGKSYLLKVKGLGGLILLIHDKTAYYSHNGTTKEGRQKFIPTLLTWEAIKLAKKLGCVRFDFEGIADERFPITKKWQGFTRFKRSFGGVKVEYIGSFSKFNFKELLWPK